jgi:hypothetical protein
MRYSKLLFILSLMILAVTLPTNVHAAVLVTVTPTTQFVSQGNQALFTISLTGANPGKVYALSLSGLTSGAAFAFSANPVTASAAGTAMSTLTVDASTAALYCPGTYSFAVTATSSAPPDSGTSTVSTLTVAPVGPPIQVSLSTDKPSYRLNDQVTILFSVNRDAYARLTITDPTGSPTPLYGPLLGSSSKTLTADKVGRWRVDFQADDYCGGSSSAVVFFDVSPDTYDVSISLTGVPSQVSVNLKVDGQNQGTMLGTDIKKSSFKVDTSHTVGVDQYVTGDTGVRYYCAQDSRSVSSAASLVFDYETQYLATVVTDPDGATQVSGGGWYKAGSTVQTSQAPLNLTGPAGTKYVFKGWILDGAPQAGNPTSFTLDKPHKIVAKYQIQYQLVIDSPGGLGSPKGSGYYDSGSTVQFSVTSPEGLLIQQVFVRWEGDYSGTSPQGTITMDAPKLVHAVWTTDYTQLYIALAVLAAAIVVAGFLFWRRRQQALAPPETKPTPAMPGEQPATSGESEAAAPQASGDMMKCSSCGADMPVGQTFCHECGAKVGQST